MNILTDGLGGTFKTDSGTSMAAPFVSAVAELLLGQSPTRSVSDVQRPLAGSADKVGTVSYGSDPYNLCVGCTWNSSRGHGRLNANRALTIAAPAPAPDFSIAVSPSSLSVARGQKTATPYTVTATALNGFKSTISLATYGRAATAQCNLTATSTNGFVGNGHVRELEPPRRDERRLESDLPLARLRQERLQHVQALADGHDREGHLPDHAHGLRNGVTHTIGVTLVVA